MKRCPRRCIAWSEERDYPTTGILLSGIGPFLIAVVVALVLSIVAIRRGNASGKRLGKAALIIDAICVVLLVLTLL